MHIHHTRVCHINNQISKTPQQPDLAAHLGQWVQVKDLVERRNRAATNVYGSNRQSHGVKAKTSWGFVTRKLFPSGVIKTGFSYKKIASSKYSIVFAIFPALFEASWRGRPCSFVFALCTFLGRLRLISTWREGEGVGVLHSLPTSGSIFTLDGIHHQTKLETCHNNRLFWICFLRRLRLFSCCFRGSSSAL